MWKCVKCGAGTDKGYVGIGGTCKDHEEEILREDREATQKRRAELLAEKVNVLPDALDLAAFDRFFLKLALHMIEDLKKNPKLFEKVKRNNPLCTIPEEFTLHLKEQVLFHLSREYVEVTEARGHERWFHGGTFKIVKPIPAQVLVDALVAAKLAEGPKPKKAKKRRAKA